MVYIFMAIFGMGSILPQLAKADVTWAPLLNQLVNTNTHSSTCDTKSPRISCRSVVDDFLQTSRDTGYGIRLNSYFKGKSPREICSNVQVDFGQAAQQDLYSSLKETKSSDVSNLGLRNAKYCKQYSTQEESNLATGLEYVAKKRISVEVTRSLIALRQNDLLYGTQHLATVCNCTKEPGILGLGSEECVVQAAFAQQCKSISSCMDREQVVKQIVTTVEKDLLRIQERQAQLQVLLSSSSISPDSRKSVEAHFEEEIRGIKSRLPAWAKEKRWQNVGQSDPLPTKVELAEAFSQAINKKKKRDSDSFLPDAVIYKTKNRLEVLAHSQSCLLMGGSDCKSALLDVSENSEPLAEITQAEKPKTRETLALANELTRAQCVLDINAEKQKAEDELRDLAIDAGLALTPISIIGAARLGLIGARAAASLGYMTSSYDLYDTAKALADTPKNVFDTCSGQLSSKYNNHLDAESRGEACIAMTVIQELDQDLRSCAFAVGSALIVGLGGAAGIADARDLSQSATLGARKSSPTISRSKDSRDVEKLNTPASQTANTPTVSQSESLISPIPSDTVPASKVDAFLARLPTIIKEENRVDELTDQAQDIWTDELQTLVFDQTDPRARFTVLVNRDGYRTTTNIQLDDLAFWTLNDRKIRKIESAGTFVPPNSDHVKAIERLSDPKLLQTLEALKRDFDIPAEAAGNGSSYFHLNDKGRIALSASPEILNSPGILKEIEARLKSFKPILNRVQLKNLEISNADLLYFLNTGKLRHARITGHLGDKKIDHRFYKLVLAAYEKHRVPALAEDSAIEIGAVGFWDKMRGAISIDRMVEIEKRSDVILHEMKHGTNTAKKNHTQLIQAHNIKGKSLEGYEAYMRFDELEARVVELAEIRKLLSLSESELLTTSNAYETSRNITKLIDVQKRLVHKGLTDSSTLTLLRDSFGNKYIQMTFKDSDEFLRMDHLNPLEQARLQIKQSMDIALLKNDVEEWKGLNHILRQIKQDSVKIADGKLKVIDMEIADDLAPISQKKIKSRLEWEYMDEAAQAQYLLKRRQENLIHLTERQEKNLSWDYWKKNGGYNHKKKRGKNPQMTGLKTSVPLLNKLSEIKTSDTPPTVTIAIRTRSQTYIQAIDLRDFDSLIDQYQDVRSIDLISEGDLTPLVPEPDQILSGRTKAPSKKPQAKSPKEQIKN